MSALHNATVLGSGVLGGQIAWHSAFTGKTVALYDIDDAALERCRAAHEQYAAIYLAGQGATEADIAATRSRLSFTTDLASAVADADVVIEAVPEIPEVKSDVYAKLAPLLPDRTIVATNSSSLLPSTFADVTGRPDKFCALHFGNGIWDMNLAEIMGHAGTAKQTLLEITEFAIEIGMVPIPVLKESNGYVLNGWSIPLTRAALSLVVTGVSTPEDVDRTFMKLGGSAFGPFGLTDMVGLETIYNLSVYWGSIDQDEEHLAIAAYVKENFLDKGRLGLQSGQGFYSWPNPAYLQPGFLDVPDVSAASSIVDLITQTRPTQTRPTQTRPTQTRPTQAWPTQLPTREILR